ncbi:uncharacterized protein LOC116029780 [Ipomoea triloba]|uniref:uncharacterized protein LOC116029780 n=1 Tax=Ipomoea triloba TaxID=35885 RepID=UPI00125D7BC1|nr:uncharacterized protein LOC116029780 [Ipomoea triloba]
MATPFSPDIMEVPLPKDFRLPTIKAYTSTSDLRAHMTRYKATVVMIGASDAIICRAFLSTLDETAQDWFNTIPDGSIQTFAELSKSFLTYFSGNIQHKKPFSHLCGAAILIFIQALRSGNFHRQLNTHHPRSYEELMRIAHRYAEAEEADRKKKDEEDGRKSVQPDKIGPTNHAPHPNQLSATKGKVQERPRLAPPRHLTPLTHPSGYFTQFVKYPGQYQHQQGLPDNVWRKEDPEPSACNNKKRRCDQGEEGRDSELKEKPAQCKKHVIR